MFWYLFDIYANYLKHHNLMPVIRLIVAYYSIIWKSIIWFLCGARTADPPVGGVGMDRGRTKHAVLRGEILSRPHCTRSNSCTLRSDGLKETTMRHGPTRIPPCRVCNMHRGLVVTFKALARLKKKEACKPPRVLSLLTGRRRWHPAGCWRLARLTAGEPPPTHWH